MAAPLLTGLATLIPMNSQREVDEDHTGVTLAVRLIPNVPVTRGDDRLRSGRRHASDRSCSSAASSCSSSSPFVRSRSSTRTSCSPARSRHKVAARTAELATLGSIITSATDAIVGLSLDNRILTWNAAAERLYGLPAAEMIGRTLDFMPASDHGPLAELIDQARRTANELPSLRGRVDAAGWNRRSRRHDPLADRRRRRRRGHLDLRPGHHRAAPQRRRPSSRPARRRWSRLGSSRSSWPP